MTNYLLSEEEPVSCCNMVRHHVNSLPQTVIDELNRRGYDLHNEKYYYVKYEKMLDIIEHCIKMEG